jgi:hypothetical protein
MRFSAFSKPFFFSFFLIVQIISACAQNEVISKIKFPAITGDSTNGGKFNTTYNYKGTYVSATLYDTINEVLYVAGGFNQAGDQSKSGLAAIDLVKNTVLPFKPVIDGYVYALAKKGDTIYIGGLFNSVNGQPRKNLAACNGVTGSLLNWAPNPDDLVGSLYCTNEYLCVGGEFHTISNQPQQFMCIYSIANLTFKSNQPLLNNDTTGHCSKITIYDKKIYYIPNVMGNFKYGNSLYAVSLINGKVEKVNKFPKNITSNSLSGYKIISDKIFYGGYQMIGNGDKFIACSDLDGNLISSWDSDWPFLTNNPYSFKFESYKNSLFIACHTYYFWSDWIVKCNKEDGKKSTSFSHDSLNFVFTDFIVGNDKLILLKKTRTTFDTDSIRVYCLAAPPTPAPFQTFTASVCKGQKQVSYSIPESKKYTYYKWSYSATGATINGTGNNITIDFAENATAGVLRVTGFNQCDMKSPPVELNITIMPGPALTLASTGNITCTQPQVQLSPSSNTSVNYSWSGPGNFTSNLANVQVNQAGSYQLKITATTTGCSTTESIVVKADTAKPKPVITANTYLLTCNQPAILIKGSTQNNNDSLRWATPTGIIVGSSITVSATGNYTFTALNKINGCKASLTATITSNTTAPQLSLPTSIDTLTCKKSSIVVNLSSSTPGSTLSWQDVAGTIYQNPATLTTGGVYTAIASDKANGCVTKAAVTIPEDRVLPLIQLPTHQQQLTCSYPYTFIKAISNHDSIDLNWTDPLDSILANPVYVTKPGTYKITASNPYTGCTSKDQVQVSFTASLIVSAGTGIQVCPGNGNATLQATVTDPYHYAGALTYDWQPGGGKEATFTVQPKTNTLYTLTVKSNKGCQGSSSVFAGVRPVMQDSLSITQPCFNNDGKVKIKIKDGTPPYKYWAADSSGTILKPAQDSALFENLKGFTTYYFHIKDSYGCIKQSEPIHLGATLKEPVINFLVSSYLMSKDTFVLVNVSNPLPDSVTWHIERATILYSDNQKAIAARNDTGTVAAGLEVKYGRCRSIKYKNIRIAPFDSTVQIPEQLKGISYLNLNPNPNTGRFTITIKLGVKQNFTVLIYDALGINYYQEKVQGSDSYQQELNLNLLPGTYILKVIATYDVKQKAFLVNK